jgi:uncharacterized protein YbjQ (UPF0145 family)
MYAARELAMARMEAEADALEADGIVGVRLDIHLYEWARHLAEFVAIGTAVTNERGQSWRTPQGRPFTSDLSGQDFWTLVQTGYMPLGLVLGTCVYHIAHQSTGRWIAQITKNQEMPDYTQALYNARELAMERMQHEATTLEAEGIVGVQLEERSHAWGSHAIEFLAIGTAVRPLRSDHHIPPPQMMMMLDR